MLQNHLGIRELLSELRAPRQAASTRARLSFESTSRIVSPARRPGQNPKASMIPRARTHDDWRLPVAIERWNGEKRLIRPDPDKPIDILGSGFVVAPPSHGTKSKYQFIEGSLDDLDCLPHLREPPPDINGHSHLATSPANERIGEGARNKNLWEHCMRAAHNCDDFDALLDVARTRNAEFVQPLTDSEVVKTAKSAWSITERGENRFGRPGIFFEAKEATDLICSDPDVFLLLAFLRANNGPASTFFVANGLAAQLGMGLKRFVATRLRLEQTHIKMVRPPSTANGPALYRWVSKGGQN